MYLPVGLIVFVILLCAVVLCESYNSGIEHGYLEKTRTTDIKYQEEYRKCLLRHPRQ
jgi:hypothetical protein